MSWLWLIALGGIVGLDATSFPQVMLSRPLVAGTLAGLAFGRPGAGLLVGAILEVFDLGILPVGASRYPEGGTAAVAATAAFLAVDADATAALLLAVLFGLAWERVAGASVVLVRHWTERIVETAEPPDDTDIERRHLTAMSLDFARGAIVCVAGAATGALLLTTLVPLWGAAPGTARAAMIVTAAGAAGAALTVFGGWTERRHVFLLGVVCGSLLLFALA